MNKVSQVKSSIRKERWLSIIKECQSSGMTIPDVKPAVIIRRGDTTIEINSNASKETVEAVLIALTSS